MAKNPFHIARQEHLGDMLDELESRGRLRWVWEDDRVRRRAIWHVKQGSTGWRALDTRSAEGLVQAECDELRLRWRPVLHPGGETQRAAVQAWIDEG